MSFPVNCGLEIQTPELNMGILKEDEFFCPDELITWFLDSSKHFSVYADADTDLSDAQKINLIKKMKTSNKIHLEYASTTGTLSTTVFPKRSRCGHFFNDAEFILTVLKTESISENELGLYLARHCLQGGKKVVDFLNQQTDPYRLVQLSFSTPKKTPTTGRRTLRSSTFSEKDWRFTKLFHVKKSYSQSMNQFRHVQGTTQPLSLENLVFFSKEDYSPDSSHFYFQATIGLPLEKVWPTMVALSKSAMKTSFLKGDDLADISYILELDSVYREQKELASEDPLLYAVAPLLNYWIYSNNNRKNHGFFIRHFMTHLIKVLSEEQLARLKTIDDRIRQNQQLMDTLWKEPWFPHLPPPGQDLQVRQRRIIVKELENLLYSRVFPVQLQGKDTFVLVEIRYLNHILNYFLDPKAKKASLLSVEDLERIVHKLERKTQPSPTPQRTTKRRKKTHTTASI